MPNVRTIKTSFVGGEVSPELFGRLDVGQEQNGLAVCRNFVVLPHGPVQNRAGTRFISAVKNSANFTRLIPFSFNNTQTMAIELGAGYFRFHPLEGTLMAGPAGQLLSNALFASGVGTGWTNSSTGTATVTGTGQAVLTSPNGSSTPQIYQQISTVAGQLYDFMAEVNGNGKLIVESSPGAGDIMQWPIANSTLQGISHSVTVPGTTAYVRIVGATSATTTFKGVSARLNTAGLSPFDSNTAYSVGQAIYDYTGIPYYCIQASASVNQPTNSAYFTPWAAPYIYEVANSYTAADLMNIHYVQSGDVITFVHPSYPPMQLERFANLQWVFAAISFQSTLSPPATVTATASYTHSGTPLSFQYVVTALDAYGMEESLASAVSATCTNDLTISGNYNVITWTPVVGAGFYNIYKQYNGVFGYVGQVPAATTGFYDRNILPDFTQTYPIANAVFQGAGNYPSAVGYYEQRRVFGGTNSQPQNIWATQPGTESNMNYSVPSQASDALYVRIAALRANYIQHVLPLMDLIVLTASTEWRVYTASGDALAPSTITIKAQSQNGANNVQPVVVDNTGIYGASQGGHVRSITYKWESQGYQSSDLCLLARHLFDPYSVVDLAFTRSPYPILWVVRSDGCLLGCTFLPDQQVLAWHQHWTGAGDGFFESICVVMVNGFDILHAVVRRVVNGQTVRYVEALDPRQYDGVLSNAYFVDCGATFTGPQGTYQQQYLSLLITLANHGFSNGQQVYFSFSDSTYGFRVLLAVTVVDANTFTVPITLDQMGNGDNSGTAFVLSTTISGLTWLANKTVAVLGDGVVQTPVTVSNTGVITLAAPANTVQVGLPIDAQITTVPAAVQGDASMGQGHVKNVNKVFARCVDFTGCQAGPDGGTMVPVAPLVTDGNGNPALANGEWRVNVWPSYGPDGMVTISQPNPLPLTVCDVSLEVAIGG